MNETAQQDFERGTEPGISPGTVLFGLILLSLGLLWLLDIANVIDITWTFVSAVMLILVGIALILGAREGSHGGLVFLGVVLTLVVLIGSLVTWPGVSGAVGERSVRPATIENVDETYSWGIGSQTVDLRDVEFPAGETTIQIQQGIGEIVVRLPEDTGYRVEWSGGVGNAVVFDREQSGFGLGGTQTSDGFDQQDSRVVLDIQLGIGAIAVRQ